MTQLLQKPPVCKKHGCEKVWRKRKDRKSGGEWVCKRCAQVSAVKWVSLNRKRVAGTSRRWAKANPEKVKKSLKEWQKQNVDKSKQYAKQWREENADKKAECARIWHAAHSEGANEKARLWREANPEKQAAIYSRRRARKRNATIPGRPVTAAIEAERKALFDGCCFCGAKKKLTLEHMVPLSKGGLHAEENLLGSCAKCNCSKRARPVESWYKKQPFFDQTRWNKIVELTG